MGLRTKRRIGAGWSLLAKWESVNVRTRASGMKYVAIETDFGMSLTHICRHRMLPSLHIHHALLTDVPT